MLLGSVDVTPSPNLFYGYNIHLKTARAHGVICAVTLQFTVILHYITQRKFNAIKLVSVLRSESFVKILLAYSFNFLILICFFKSSKDYRNKTSFW